MGDHFPGPGNMVETVDDVVRDFDAMAAECGGLEAATIHAMTTRIQAAHAREADRAVANERVRDVHTCHDQCTKTELCRMTRRAEAAEADARRYRWLRDDMPGTDVLAFRSNYRSPGWYSTRGTELDAAIDAAIGDGDA